MPVFKFRAVDSRGEIVRGFLGGESFNDVRQTIKAEGFIPIEINPHQEWFKNNNLWKALKYQRQISSLGWSQFCRQLSIIVKSGLNMLNGLEVLARQIPDKALRSQVKLIHWEVQKGSTIAEAAWHPGSRVPQLLRNMLATGEASGTLEEVLNGLAEYYEREHRTRQKIKSASIYPTVLIIMAVGMLVFFFSFMLPRFVSMFNAAGGQLPLITRFVINLSEFLKSHLVPVLAVPLVLVILSRIYFSTPGGRLARDRLVSCIPLLGDVVKTIVTMRFAWTAFIMSKSGLPLLTGLEHIKHNVNNALAERALNYAIEGLQRGETLAENLAKAKFFSPLAIHMVSMGEETGELENVLKEMAVYYEQESDAQLTRLLAMAEPVMLIVIYSIVGFIIISVMLPILTITSQVQ